MKPKGLFPFALLWVLTFACIIPGLEAPVPGPVDPNMISTIVVSTANAAASQTAAAQPFASVTPAGTTHPGMTGAAVEQLKDGTIKYNDYDGGFELIYPVGWLAVRPNSDEFNTSLAKDGAGNPMLHDQMTTDMAGYDAKLDRLYSYILRPDIKQKYFFGISKLKWYSEDTTLLDNAVMGELVQGLESSGVIPGFHADTAQVQENGNAVTMIQIGGHSMMSIDQGGTVPIYSTVVFFKPTSNSLTRITFSYLQDYNAQISTDVNSIIESIKVAGQ
jgi:hypothetical protein